MARLEVEVVVGEFWDEEGGGASETSMSMCGADMVARGWLVWTTTRTTTRTKLVKVIDDASRLDREVKGQELR
jgi:hypothetical protein